MKRKLNLSALALTSFILLSGCDVQSPFDKQIREAQIEANELKMKSIETILAAYALGSGNYPTTEQGLKALVEPPKTEPIPKRWKQQMRTVPVDSWGNEYSYELFPEYFNLSSKGVDKDDASDDIVIRCEFYNKDK